VLVRLVARGVYHTRDAQDGIRSVIRFA